MSSDRTALDHLRDGRAALVGEIDRLTAARDELDAVIARIEGSSAGPPAAPTATKAASTDTRAQPAQPPSSTPSAVKPARAAKPARPTRRSGLRTRPDAPKSIRVHVVEMLEAEDRDFGLAEIIERIHAAGIRAHDDAVRSITIKLMKDGTVERVGRGHYRRARRPDRAPDGEPVPSPGRAAVDGHPEAEAEPSTGPDTAPVTAAGDPASTPDPGGSNGSPPPGAPPALNLSQPWPTEQF